eukprot:7954579-Prorocentrum_lima.AAC.1
MPFPLTSSDNSPPLSLRFSNRSWRASAALALYQLIGGGGVSTPPLSPTSLPTPWAATALWSSPTTSPKCSSARSFKRRPGTSVLMSA